MKKRICFFSGDVTRSGGTERVSVQLANELVKEEEYEICFLSLVEQADAPFYEIDKKIPRYALGTHWINPGPGYLPLIGKLKKFLKEKEIDIIIDIDIVLDVLSIPAAKKLKTKVVSWEHFNCEFEQSVLYRRWISKLSAKKADYIVTLTEEDKENYKRILNRNTNVEAIYNLVSPMKLDESIKRENWIVTVGRLTYQKGIDYLIEVAKEVLKENKDWKWLILGDGEERNTLEQAIAENHLENQLILKGRVENIEWYLNRSKLFVLTSRYEGLGMCLIEAMQMKVPCISFDVKIGPSEIIEAKKNGILISPFDTKKMAEEINKLLNHKKRLQEMSENTMLHFERFQTETIIKKWKKVFQTLEN